MKLVGAVGAAVAVWLMIPVSWTHPDTRASGELVIPYYYPDRTNRKEAERGFPVQTVDECRRWVSFKAAHNDDRRFQRGDYQCAIHRSGTTIARTTVR